MEDVVKGVLIITGALAVAVFFIIFWPPWRLGKTLRQMLTERYRLSRSMKVSCCVAGAIPLALPLLLLLPSPEPHELLLAVWSGALLGMSTVVLMVTGAAYRQHFAPHRREIRQAQATFRGRHLQHRFASLRLWRTNRTLERIERKHGRLLHDHDDLRARMDALIESGDPALCRIKIGHWENQYSALPPKRLAEELTAVVRETAGVPEAHQGTLTLQALVLESQLLHRELAKHRSAARFDELKAERDELQGVVAGCTETMNECKRIQSERTAKVAQLKHQRLLIR